MMRSLTLAALVAVAACSQQPSEVASNQTATIPVATAPPSAPPEPAPPPKPVEVAAAAPVDPIDAQTALNHRQCIARGGLWDTSVVTPTTDPAHPMIGECQGIEDRQACPGDNLETACWKFVIGDAQNLTASKAPHSFRACKTDPPDPMC